MPGTILASLTGLGSDRSVLEASVAAARIQDAHIQCLHTRIDVVETAALAATASPRHNADLHDMLQKVANEQEDRSRHARQAFEDVRNRHGLPLRDAPDGAGVSMAWKEEHSFLNETLHEARYHDLTVMGRDEELSRERIISVLMRSGRPLLLAPQKPVDVMGRKVAIAWKAGPESARALTAARAILSAAGSVVILSVSEDSDSDADRLAAEHLASQLAWHGIKTEIKTRSLPKSSTSDALLDMAFDGAVDLLVMGAYGHSRAKEFIFGGVTRDLLASCPLPLFMVS